MKRKILVYWPLILILPLAAVVLAYKIDKPFWGHHDWNGVYWGSIARSIARGQFVYNFHYLPLFPVIWAGFLKVFGIANWVSRLMAVVFSLGAISVFYLLVKKYHDQKTAIIASLLWLATPMFIYFGKMPVHEIPLMFFVLLAFWFYLAKKFWPLFVCVALAEAVTWPGFFLVPTITFHLILTKTFSRRYLLLWLLSFSLFGLHLLSDYLVTGDFFGGGLREIFFLRIRAVSLVPYVLQLARWAWTYYFLLIPLALLALITRKSTLLVPFLIYAVFYPIVFRDASFRHDYLLIYFWPFLALGAALVLKNYRLTVLVVVLMLLFRYKFILALEDSDIYKDSVVFGQYINQNSQPTDKVFAVTSDPTIPWDGWFIAYYADRFLLSNQDDQNIPNNVDKIFYFLPGGKIQTKAL